MDRARAGFALSRRDEPHLRRRAGGCSAGALSRALALAQHHLGVAQVGDAFVGFVEQAAADEPGAVALGDTWLGQVAALGVAEADPVAFGVAQRRLLAVPAARAAVAAIGAV